MASTLHPAARPLGNSGLSTPPLILGGNVFGWTVDGAEAFAILDAFIEAGGTMIDTADVYSAWLPGHSGGESERLLGEWLSKRGRRDDVLIATKVGMMPNAGGKGLQPSCIETAVDASLKRLQTDYIDLYFAHQDDPDTPQEAVAEAFDKLVKAGKVRALGASNFSADRLASALDIAASAGFTPYTVLQPELNLVKRDGFEGPLQQLCLERDIAAIPYFALASGYLTGKYRSAQDIGKSQRGGHIAELIESGRGAPLLKEMDDIAAETGASLAQIALAWNAAQPAVSAPIASATSTRQLQDLLGALTLTLSPDALNRLDAASRKITEPA